MSNLATIVNNILADSGIDDINVVVTTGSYNNPAWITGLSWSKISSTPTTLSGYGITDAVPANRTITINGTAQDLSANRSWSVGTVTSVDMTVPTGFSISGRPITSSGTLALTFAAGYSLPTTAVQSNWTTAYNDSIVSAAVSGTTTKTLTLTQQDGGTITASWTDYDTAPVTSVNAGTGISVNSTTGAVTVTNTGVLSVNGSTGAITGIATTAQLANYLPLAGGTMTGDILWAQTDRGITWSFNTDGAYIKFYNTGDGDTNSRLEFATIDNNNEYFRWGHIPSGGSFYESMRLVPIGSGSAELTVSGKIIKSGGTASQFLKANGDVDSTAYTPQSRTLTINGVSQDLSADRSWTITAGVSSVSAGTGISVNQTTGAVTVTNTGTLTVAGTTNQVLVNGGTAAANGNITLSLPQSIGTSNTPTFGGLVVSGTETRQINLVLPASYNGTGYGNLIERINFPWYSEYWDIGVRRGGASDIQSMEFWLNGTTKIFEITKTSGLAYLGGNTILTSANYNSYAPTLTGTGASGTWGINITGNAATATNATSAVGASNLYLTSLGNGSVNVNNGSSAVYRNENGSGAALAYAPVLHIGGGDTMWQAQGTYGTSGNGTLYFRQGYNGSWGNWLTMLSSANYTSYAVPTSGYEFSTTFSLGTMYASTGIQGSNLDYMIGVYTNGYIYRFTSGAVASWIGLGSYLPLSGGTLTGTLFFSNNIGTAIQGTMGNNDFWRIYATGGDNAGYLEIATADDAAEPIYFSQYTGVFTTLIRRVTLLDGSGGSSFPGTVSISGGVNVSGNSNWFGGYGSGSGPGFSFENQGSFARVAFWGFDFWDWDHGQQMVLNSNYVSVNNYLQAGNSLRAPIFYDSQNIGFYLDPNGYSNLSVVNIGAYTQMGVALPDPGANYGNGRIYIRLHPVQGRIASLKIDLSATWNWAAAFGFVSADVSYYCDGTNLYYATTTITSATGQAINTINIGNPVIENGYVSIPVYSANSNGIFCRVVGSPSFDWSQVTVSGWSSVSFPGQCVVNVPGSMSIGGTLTVSGNITLGGNTVATQSWVNAQGFVTGGPYLPLTGGTISGNLTINGIWQTNISTSGGWSKLSFTASTAWGDPGSYGVLGASGGNEPGVMINNPHIVWNSGNSAACIRLGRSGGVSSGAWYQVATMGSNEFMIAKNADWGNGGIKITDSGVLYYGNTGHRYVWESGTWGINISGNSATTNQLNFGGGTAMNNSAWAGGGTYHGYTYSGGNFRFGFSSTSGVVDVYADGNFYATDNSYLVLHTANYNSYAPTLTGGGASGTWGISITGNAATASDSSAVGGVDISRIVYGDNSTKTSNFGNPNDTRPSGFWNNYTSTNVPYESWWHMIVNRHSNPANNYQLQIIGEFWDNGMYFRKVRGNNTDVTSWARIVNSVQDPYAANMNQYVRTTDAPTFSSNLYISADGSSGYVASRMWLYSHNNYRGAGIYMSGTNKTWFAGTPYTDFEGLYIIARTDSAGDDACAQIGNRRWSVDGAGNTVQTGAVYATNLIDYNNNTYYLNLDGGGYLRGLVTVTGGHYNSAINVILRADENGAGSGQVTLRAWCSEPGVTWNWAGFGYNVTNDGGSPGGFSRINGNFGQAYMRFSEGGQLRFYNTNTSGTRVETAIFAENGSVTFNYGSTFNNNVKIYPVGESWGEGLAFIMPTTSTWGGLRWQRQRAGNDGNWYLGFTALDASDDLVFGANNGGTQVNNIIRMTKAGPVSFVSTVTASAFYESSDRRIKDLVDSNYKVQDIELVKPKLYKKNGVLEYGYYAQDFKDLLPSAIHVGDNGFLNLSYTQVHSAKIAYLEDSIEEIKAKILYLENQLKTKQ